MSLVLISAIVRCAVLSPGVPEIRRSTLSRSCYCLRSTNNRPTEAPIHTLNAQASFSNSP